MYIHHRQEFGEDARTGPLMPTYLTLSALLSLSVLSMSLFSLSLSPLSLNHSLLITTPATYIRPQHRHMASRLGWVTPLQPNTRRTHVTQAKVAVVPSTSSTSSTSTSTSTNTSNSSTSTGSSGGGGSGSVVVVV